jgi:ATP-dependent DNA ligase
LVVFDVLALEGRDLRELTLIERKKILEVATLYQTEWQARSCGGTIFCEHATLVDRAAS